MERELTVNVERFSPSEESAETGGQGSRCWRQVVLLSGVRTVGVYRDWNRKPFQRQRKRSLNRQRKERKLPLKSQERLLLSWFSR